MIKTVVALASVSRGGSNAFAAAMHSHPSICSVARRVWENHRTKLYIDINSLYASVCRTKKTIYYSGGHKKNMFDVRCFVLDKVFEKRKCVEVDCVVKCVAVVRNPFAVVNSMHWFHKMYGFDAWKQTRGNINKFISGRFKSLLFFCLRPDCKVVLFDDFMSNSSVVLSAVFKFVGVGNYVFESFDKVFADFGCLHCGDEVTAKKTDGSVVSGVLKKSKKKFPLTDHFYCERCDCFTLGYGGFNPCLGLRCSTDWQVTMPKQLKNITYSVLSNVCGKNIADKFVNNKIVVEDIV